jgi:integrase
MAKAKKLKSGNWRVLVYEYTDEKQKRHYKSITAATRKEAEYLAAQYALNRNIETYEDLTLAEAYERYINSKSAVLSPSTIAGYERSKKNHFKKLMPMKLSKITSKHIQIAVNEMAVDHSPKSVRNAHGLLHSVIKTYTNNFEFNTTLPQKIKPSYIIPTTDEINKLLAVSDERIRVPILLASNGGLRRSEVCALTVDDFTDLGVNINKAAVYDKNSGVIVKTTKTTAGTRFVPLPQYVIEEARKWNYFGCTPSTLSNWYHATRKKADIPIFSFHKLRHYFASELHAQGIPDKYIAEVGGWETVEMLQRIYQHTLRDKQEEMGNKVISIFNSNFEKCNTKCNTKKSKSSV